ncbi:hypothetical protein DA075_22365 [Methylobacterium currus]|jgi:hypothetical protein|uniref:Uncharacterized protein n=1 Tax=Methylobacterium currus TaxID=2051553 RepID=A0A2R4WP36_9HYPH|nr:hypothetical protein [Methylobacterium currus]AWB23289.1 hypothetical protein DA075_22270 [Methylobacterium currus]AWB23304.1 hypothetical protein DA075_22365 [Methylobacterium currus]
MDFDIVEEFNNFLYDAGCIWDVLDRDAGWRLAAYTVIEREARTLTELWNEREGRERSRR